MRINEPFAPLGMIVATVDIADPGIGHLQAGYYLAKLKQKMHRLATLVAYRIMRVLNEHRIAADVGNVRGIQVVPVKVWAKNLG